MKKRKGFTLVELLIVIAIIGVLTATVLTSLGDARESGINAKIMAELDGLSKRASIEFSETGSYNSACGTNGTATSTIILNLITSVETLSPESVVCNGSHTEFAVSAAMMTNYWCVDSTGQRKEINAALTPGQMVCP